METQKLKKETFAALKELSGIQQQIGEARTAVAKLKDEQSAYLASREKMANEVITETFEKSTDMLNDIGKHFEQLKTWHREVKGHAKELSNLTANVLKMRKDADKHLFEEKKQLKEHTKTLSLQEKELKSMGIALKEEQKTFEREKKALEEAKRKVQDDRDTLQRAWNELERKRV